MKTVGDDGLMAEGAWRPLDMGKQQRQWSGATTNRYLSGNNSSTCQEGKRDHQEYKW